MSIVPCTIRCTCLGVLTAGAIVYSLPAYAQAASETQANIADPSDIIVTARKREERAIDVPASLNVFAGDTLSKSGVNSLTDLQYKAPGLKIAQAGAGTRISLRGIGTNISIGSPSIAVHVDGIYIPVTRFALSELYDVSRVEVLKGPEGTLYGRNATGASSTS